MDVEEFEDLVDRFGEDLSQWPVSSRAAGAALLRDSAEAQRVVEEAGLLRRAFARDRSQRAPADLAGRIAACATQQRVPVEPRWTFAWRRLALPTLRFRPAVLLPLCFLVGLTLSLIPTPSAETGSSLDVPTFFLGCCGGWSREPGND